MDTATVDTIEAGAWLDEMALSFPRAYPQGSHSMKLSRDALPGPAAHNQVCDGVGDQPASPEADVLTLLTPLTRADYLMQQFCRTSSVPLAP
jgi:hypothetical protein